MKYTLTLSALISLMLLSDVSAAEDAHNKIDTNQTISKTGESGKHDSQPLSKNQQSVLKMTHEIAISDGLKNPAVLKGIIMQESKAGTAKKFRTAAHKKSSDQTVGLGQIKVGTAKTVLKRYPELRQQFGVSDSSIQNMLAHNDRFNVAVASKYIKMLYEIRRDDDYVIAAYNKGPGGAMHIKKPYKLPYVKAVKGHISSLHFS